MNKLLIEACFDGDLETKMSGVEYSTSVRSIVTVGELVDRYNSEWLEVFKVAHLNSKYGKIVGLKTTGVFIDETV